MRTVLLSTVTRRTGYSQLRHLKSRFPVPHFVDKDEAGCSPILIPQISLSQERYFSSDATDSSSRSEKARQAAAKGAKSAGELTKTYGPVFIGTYLSVYVATLASLFLGVESGALDPAYVLSWVTDDDQAAKSSVQVIADFLDHYPWTRPYVPIIERNPEMANLGVAWVATKFTEPLRLAITIPIVPRVARAIGWVEPKAEPKNAEQKDTTDQTSEKN